VSPVHVVVDGSNIATEGRTMPSLRQLDDAVRQFQDEFPDAEPIVVVDATFGHRIDASERKAFDEAVSHGEIVSPPAGAIGRGDAFVLGIAERVNGQVLSNDSFQEFLPEHEWLFDEGRLIGGKPVPGVGWIFTPRRPVRGARSRTGERKSSAASGRDGRGAAASSSGRRRGRSGVLEAVEAAAAEATEAAAVRAEDQAAESPAKAPAASSGRRRRRRRRTGDPAVQAAIDAATEEAVGPAAALDTGKRPAKAEAGLVHGPQAVNDPLTFLTFISEHPLGDEVRGSVSNFVSHGAMVDVGDMHCYVPLSGLGVPPPASARAVLRKGETRRFMVVALDPARRGAQLALPEVASKAAQVTPSGGEAPPAPRKGQTARPSKGDKPAGVSKPAKATKAAKPAKPAKATKAAKAAKAAAGTKEKAAASARSSATGSAGTKKTAETSAKGGEKGGRKASRKRGGDRPSVAGTSDGKPNARKTKRARK
jgi:hypothetical protein